MRKREIVLLVMTLFFSVIGRSQNPTASFLWNNEAVTNTIETYFLHDSAASRMKISWVKMVATSDTLTAGISTRAVNDPSCNSCKLIRFASLGEPVYQFDNSFADGSQRYRSQSIYNQQLKPERELNYAKDPGNEVDTAYHMTSFTLTSYYTGFTISKTYLSKMFSANPSYPPDVTSTKTYNADGTLKWSKTSSKNFPDANDSAIYSYPDKNTSVEKYFVKGDLLWTTTRKTDPQTGQIISESELAKTEENQFYTHVINYSYDTQHRLVSVSYSDNKNRADVRYDENGLPKMVVVYINGQMQAVVFYYSFYQ
ncbi:MAG TPA: hypothetical protein VL651_00565 [Bacteroidia bacterium]|jgi:hypothetical protein|nr:hypothetical protein [Bacteroidia bacterium]